MRRRGFVGTLAQQTREDLASSPANARRWLSESGRAERCVNIAELRALARRRIPKAVFDFVDGAAWDELTMARNESDLRRLVVVPRVLAGLGEVDLSTTVLGQHIDAPVLGAPTGTSGLVHHLGEIGLARAVHRAGSLYVLSTAASCQIEDLAELAPGPLWFQLYVSRDHGFTKELIARAQASGYGALVVTVDVQRAGGRERDVRSGFTIPPRITAQSLIEGIRKPRWSIDFVRHPRILNESTLQARGSQGGPASLIQHVNRQFDPSLSWNDIGWVQEQWDGPIVLKGVLRPEDAQQAARLGLAGVIVSNHGGRQLDQAQSAISALPAVADAVGSEMEVYMDGGIRRGVDVMKALAMGARAVLSARALLYGLGAGGQLGATHAMRILVDELRLAMTLAGCGSASSLDRSWLTTTDAGTEILPSAVRARSNS